MRRAYSAQHRLTHPFLYSAKRPNSGVQKSHLGIMIKIHHAGPIPRHPTPINLELGPGSAF